MKGKHQVQKRIKISDVLLPGISLAFAKVYVPSSTRILKNSLAQILCQDWADDLLVVRLARLMEEFRLQVIPKGKKQSSYQVDVSAVYHSLEFKKMIRNANTEGTP